MKRKIYIRLTTYFLALMSFTALVGEVNAQPRGGGKPNDRAKKLLAQGNQFFNRKDFRSAINKYAEAIVISPKYSDAHYWKGSAHYLLKEYDETIEDLNAALEQGYTPLKVYEVRWEAHFIKENYDAALSDVEEALRIAPSDNFFILALGNIQRQKGNYQEAITAYNKVLPSDQNNGDIHYFVADSHFRLGEYAEQNLAADKAIKNSTKYPGESYFLLADALEKSKKPIEAIQAYERALNVKPDMMEVYSPLSGLYLSQSRINDAIATIKKGTKLFPKNGEMFINLTWYYSLADRHAEAVNVGVEATRLAPDNHVAHTNLCRAYNDMKQYSQAESECNKALKLQPDDGETYLYLARVNYSQNKKEIAKQYYKKAVSGLLKYTRNRPDYSDGWYLLGNAYFYDEEQYDKAIEAYKRSLELNPNFPKALLNLGTMYLLSENLPMALEQYNILLKINPRSAEKLKLLIDKKKPVN